MYFTFLLLILIPTNILFSDSIFMFLINEIFSV